MMPNNAPAAQPPEPCVLTISRQIGSGGAAIGHDLAARLGIPCYDRTILERAARQLDVSADLLEDQEERVRTLLESIAQSYVSGSPDGLYYPPALNIPTDTELHDAEAAIIAHIGQTQSAVIVGRGGVHTLRTHPRHISVFLHADESFRLPRLQELYHLSLDEAKKMLARSDRDRARFHASLSGKDWQDARQYNVCLDVTPLGVSAAVDLLYAYWQQRFGHGCRR